VIVKISRREAGLTLRADNALLCPHHLLWLLSISNPINKKPEKTSLWV